MIKDKGNLNQYFEKVTMTIRARGNLSYLMNADCQAGSYKERIHETMLSMEQTSYTELHHV